jgi:branched-chain amino acid transport system substrate-binding protein
LTVPGDANATDELGQIAGPAADGFLFTFAPDPRKYPSAQQAVADLRQQGFEPEGYTLYTVAALEVFAQAAKQAGSTELEKIVPALRGGKFKTVVGEIGFDAKGDVLEPKYSIYVYKGGKYAEM